MHASLEAGLSWNHGVQKALVLLDVWEARVSEWSDGTVGGASGATGACNSGAAESARELARRASGEDARAVTSSDEADVKDSEPLCSSSQP